MLESNKSVILKHNTIIQLVFLKQLPPGDNKLPWALIRALGIAQNTPTLMALIRVQGSAQNTPTLQSIIVEGIAQNMHTLMALIRVQAKNTLTLMTVIVHRNLLKNQGSAQNTPTLMSIILDSELPKITKIPQLEISIFILVIVKTRSVQNPIFTFEMSETPLPIFFLELVPNMFKKQYSNKCKAYYEIRSRL